MRPADHVRFASRSLGGHRVRVTLSLAGIAVGVAAVVLLTGLGEGARRYVTDEFKNLGSNILIIMPGRVETTGAAPLHGSSTRDLVLADVRAIARRSPRVRHVAPVSMGSAPMTYGGRGRTVTVLGTTAAYFAMRDLHIAAGSALPPTSPELGMRVAVIGQTVKREVFREENPLGRVIRLGDWRFRVIGILERKGTAMGMDIDDLIIVPVATGMQMFNRTGLFRITIQTNSWADADTATADVKRILLEQHDGDEDFTIVSQGSMLSALDAILETLTMALVGIAAISLTVAGIGIMNVMLVSVTERTSEIGLMKAIGASDAQVLTVFLVEAGTLALAGGILGTALGYAGAAVLEALISGFNAMPPEWAVGAALATAGAVGVVFGLLPAWRAAKVDPVVALARS